MRHYVKACFSVMMIFIYVSAYMGFGLHECSAEGTKNVVLMVEGISCEAIHAHKHKDCHHQSCIVHNHGHNSSNHSNGCPHCEHKGLSDCGSDQIIHNSDCCNTSVFIVTDSQSQNSNEAYGANIQCLMVFNHVSLNIGCPFKFAFVESVGHVPLPISAADQSVLSVWRL